MTADGSEAADESGGDGEAARARGGWQAARVQVYDSEAARACERNGGRACPQNMAVVSAAAATVANSIARRSKPSRAIFLF